MPAGRDGAKGELDSLERPLSNPHILNLWCTKSPGPEVIKLFSSLAQLSMKFQLLINVEIIKISGKFRFKTKKLVIYPANKC